MGGSGLGYVSISLRTATLGQVDRGYRTKCQSIRSAIHSQQSYIFEMATRSDNEQPKEHVHDGRTHGVLNEKNLREVYN